MKTKDTAFQRFKEGKKLVEVQTGRKVKKLRKYNGLEFVNKEFENFCSQEGILRHKTVRYTLQQNGLAERMNKTVLERVKCMLISANLPKSFWGEAVNTAVYLINRCPSAALEFKVPEEVWCGVPPDYSNLKVFGCVAYAQANQGKLEPRAKKCMFVGYPSGFKGFKLWYKEGGVARTLINRDVFFKEEEMNMMKSDQYEGESHENQTVREQVESELKMDISGLDQNEETGMQAQREVDKSDEENLKSCQLARDRARRQIRAPTRYSHAEIVSFALSVAEETKNEEPQSYREAVSRSDKNKWLKALKEEMDSLEKNETWQLVERPKQQKLVGCKWIYKVKEGIPGTEQKRYKARLVSKGYTQKKGMDYTEIYSPVVRHASIRVLLSLVVQFNMFLEQLDVKTTFLHWHLEEKIYMSQPEGFEEKGSQNKVCLLKTIWS